MVEKLVSTKQLSERVGLSGGSIKRLAAKGELPHFRGGERGKLLFSVDEVLNTLRVERSTTVKAEMPTGKS